MSLSWHQEDLGKLLVGEKKGVVRLYNILTLQPLSCIMCSSVPLSGIAWGLQSKLIIILAAGELLVTDINVTS